MFSCRDFCGSFNSRIQVQYHSDIGVFSACTGSPSGIPVDADVVRL